MGRTQAYISADYYALLDYCYLRFNFTAGLIRWGREYGSTRSWGLQDRRFCPSLFLTFVVPFRGVPLYNWTQLLGTKILGIRVGYFAVGKGIRFGRDVDTGGIGAGYIHTLP